MLPIDAVVSALKTVRLKQVGLSEFEIHDALCLVLAQSGIAHRREHTFGPRCRADIWINGVAVEVKKQRPAKAALLAQVSRYADQPTTTGIVVVLEKSILLPKEINGKPVAVISLNALWGIAL